ncbi:right-handed parallel beta-helix repeat-containing protein [Planctomycetes bacterium CA13]
MLTTSNKPLQATEYFVSPVGTDQDDGSKARPFATIQRAAIEMGPGDICWLRHGHYRTEAILKGLKGLPDKPLVFKSYPGEQVVFDGTITLPPQWSPWKDGIYQIQSGEPVWQLFTDRKLVDVARWPNASFEDGSIWQIESCMRFTDRVFARGKTIGKTTDGLIHDRNPISRDADSSEEGSEALTVNEGINQVSLGETGVDFTGAIAVLNLHHWLTWARPITDHDAGRNWFHYDNQGTKMKKYVAYYILGLPALDRANEWWYDAESETIYFRPADEIDPNQVQVTAKVRDYTLRLIECEHVVFQGLEFFASTFSMTDCEHVVVEDSRLLYPSTNKFMLGDFSWFSSSADPDKMHGKDAKGKTNRNVMTRIVNRDKGVHGNVIRNCEIAFANSPAMEVRSAGSVIENCYIHDIEWDVNSSGGSGTLSGGGGCIIRRNTIRTAGNSEGIRPGPDSIVQYNRLWDLGKLQHDGSAINIGTDAQKGTVVRYNWVHNTNRAGIRFDSTTNRMGESGCVHHNVVFNLSTHGSKFKGDRHLLFNNTFYNSYFSIPNRFGNTDGHNRNTLARNNLADTMVAWSVRRPEEPISARMENNLHGEGVVVNQLRDPANLDFRPKRGSRVIDAGIAVTKADKPTDDTNLEPPSFIGNSPDIGAYESGDRSYWIPGRLQKRASTPIPPNGAQEVQQDVSLMFLEAYGADRHIVYFSNEEKNLHHQVTLDRSNIVNPGTLQPGQRYFWRVDAVMPDGQILKGELWFFFVEN